MECYNRQVTVSNNSSNVKLAIGNKVVSVNGVNKTTDVPAIVNNNRTYVPLRFISECMGATVDWNGQNQLVSITDNTDNKPM